MSITFIRRHINRLSKGQLFTTRECLSFGSRASVDQALARLVRSGFIIRLARGVFMRDDPGIAPPPIIEIARVKARAFGRTIATHGADLAARLQLIPSGNLEPTFVVGGHSSSFRAGDTVVHLRGGCMRKVLAGETLAGQIVRALWHLGETICSRFVVMTATYNCGRTDRQELRDCVSLMPAWLGDYFVGPVLSSRRR